jgi:hypothetical protein
MALIIKEITLQIMPDFSTPLRCDRNDKKSDIENDGFMVNLMINNGTVERRKNGISETMYGSEAQDSYNAAV